MVAEVKEFIFKIFDETVLEAAYNGKSTEGTTFAVDALNEAFKQAEDFGTVPKKKPVVNQAV